MTREEIEKLPDIIDMFLSESLIIDTKEKVHKKLTEVCNLAIQALEEQDNTNSIRINFVGEEEAEEFKRYEKELLEKLKKQPLTVIPKEQPCDDCVSREALDRELYERFHEEGNIITMIPLGNVRNFIKEFPPVTPTTVWHKVEDELPKKSGEYIVEVYDTEENRNYTDIGEIDCDGVVKKWNFKSTIEVLAWMPLSKWEG